MRMYFRFDNYWEDFWWNLKHQFGFELSLWRREKSNYHNFGPEFWMGAVQLFGLSYSCSDVLPNDTRHVSLTLFGFGFGVAWEDVEQSVFE